MDSKGYVALAETQVKMGDPSAARTTLESAAGKKVIGEEEKIGECGAGLATRIDNWHASKIH